MEKKLDYHAFTGMQVDYDVTKHQPQFLVDAKNIRFTTREDGSLLAVINEQGNVKSGVIKNDKGNKADANNFVGKYLGHAVVGNFLVVFTTDTLLNQEGETTDIIDRIYRCALVKNNDKDNTIRTTDSIKLYEGTRSMGADLNFDLEHPIEALGVYESELIQKVYWVDGKNQPRVINAAYYEYNSIADIKDQILREEIRRKVYANPDLFNFVNELELKEKVTVKKEYSPHALFPAGTVQYAISYYYKYGQESNLAWISPLYYTSYIERAGSPEENINNKFIINIKNVDYRFDYIRLYSIVRTANNGQPICRIVSDTSLRGLEEKDVDEITLIDENTTGETIDPTALLYIGGEEIIAQTMTHKDGTMFLGNIEISRKSITDDNVNAKRGDDLELPIDVKIERRVLKYKEDDYDDKVVRYERNNSLNCIDSEGNSECPRTFKKGETYRLGFQLQYKTGKWSDPIFIKDVTVDKGAIEDSDNELSGLKGYKVPILKATIPLKDVDEYKRIRPVIVLPSNNERTVIAQGICTPTVYSVFNRLHNMYPWVQSSWFTRVFTNKIGVQAISERTTFENGTPLTGYYPTNFHNQLIGSEDAFRDQEIQGGGSNYYIIKDSKLIYLGKDILSKISIGKTLTYKDSELSTVSIDTNIKGPTYAVDQSIQTFYSPDIEFDESLWVNSFNKDIKFRIVGLVPIVKSYGDISITTSSAGIHNIDGFVHTTTESEGGQSLMGGPFYKDGIVVKGTGDSAQYWLAKTDYHKEGATYGPKEKGNYTPEAYYMVYPWQKNGSLNNDSSRTDSTTRTAVLKRKVISNIHISNSISYLKNPVEVTLKHNIQLFTEDVVTLKKLGDKSYYGNVETLLSPYNNYPIYAYSNARIYWERDNDGNIKNEHPLIEYNGKTPNFYTTDSDCKMNYGYNAYDDRNATGTDVVKEGVLMKYKSCPHAVIELKDSYLDYTHIVTKTAKVSSSIKTVSKIDRLGNTANRMKAISARAESKDLEDAEAAFIKKVKTLISEEEYNKGYKELYRIYPYSSMNDLATTIDVLVDKADEIIIKEPDEGHVNNDIGIVTIGETKITKWEAFVKVLVKWTIEKNKNPDTTITMEDDYSLNVGSGITERDTKSLSIPAFATQLLWDADQEAAEDGYDNYTGFDDGDTNHNHENPPTYRQNPYDAYRVLQTILDTVARDYTKDVEIIEDDTNSGNDDTNSIKNKYDFLYVGEIYRNIAPTFGGKNEYAIKHNTWLPAGESVPIYLSSDGAKAEITWKYGDTFFQRYDCLRTYSFTNEDPNSIIDIVSFMCETRVNADGRYDKNRGLVSNLNVHPINFNLRNSAYDNQDNYFQYKILDSDFYKINRWNNQITWSLQKTSNSVIDTWTTQTLANTLELNGNSGELKYLETYNNNIYAFQEHGISLINFNSRVQIPISQGVPIEISNNYKVDGYQYVSDTIGCDNKQNIIKTPSGIYFIESTTGNLYHLGEGLQDVALTNNMSSWFKDNIGKVTNLWYDNILKDLYIRTNDTVLVFTELLGSFMSFMDYQEASTMFNFGSDFFSLHYEWDEGKQKERLYLHLNNSENENEDNMKTYIFSKNKDYSIAFISNADPTITKVFNSVHANINWYNTQEIAGINNPNFFTSIQVKDSYQNTGEVRYKKKLNLLRTKMKEAITLIPRENYMDDIENRNSFKNRIVDKWARIEFKNSYSDNASGFKMHDISVEYYV